MAGLPTFSDASEAADTVRDHSRTLIPWLATPPDCGNCEVMMYAGVTFDHDLVDYVECWECRECGRQTYRDDPGPAPEPPRRGASHVRALFRE